jgi:hypothetical protein
MFLGATLRPWQRQYDGGVQFFSPTIPYRRKIVRLLAFLRGPLYRRSGVSCQTGCKESRRQPTLPVQQHSKIFRPGGALSPYDTYRTNRQLFRQGTLREPGMGRKPLPAYAFTGLQSVTHKVSTFPTPHLGGVNTRFNGEEAGGDIVVPSK